MTERYEKKGRGGGCCLGGCFGTLVGCFGIIVLIGFACVGSLFYLQQNAPSPPQNDYTPDPAQAQAFEDSISAARNSVNSGGNFEFAINESEASSWVNLRADETLGNDNPLQNVQIEFRDGVSSVYSEVDAPIVGGVGTEIGFSYNITPDGKVEVIMDTLTFGGIEMPDSFKDELSVQIQDLIDQELQEVNSRYRVSSISSADGVLIVRGSVSP